MSSILPSIPSSTFDQLVLPVLRPTGQCVIPQIFVGSSKLIVALRSDVDPTLAVSTQAQSLALKGIVFQYLQSTQSYIVHSQFCGSSFSPNACTLKQTPFGLVFERSTDDMTGAIEEWTFRSLSSTSYPFLPITKVQPIFQDMYVKKNNSIISTLQQKWNTQSANLLKQLNLLNQTTVSQ